MPLINPSFETDFTGWTLVVPTGGSAVTTTSYSTTTGPAVTYTPIQGSFFALLATDSGSAASNYITVSQSFSASTGDIISGWSFFDTDDYLPFDDNAQVLIISGSSTIATPFSASVSTVGDFGNTPWTFWQYTFTAPGVYTVQARIANALDSGVSSQIGIDALQLTSPTRGILLFK